MSHAVALNFEAYLRRCGRLTHDEELDLMQQSISLEEHYQLPPNHYMLAPQRFVACRWVEKFDLTVQWGAHSLGSAEHALLVQRLEAGEMMPNAVATGGYHELHGRARQDSVMAGVLPEIKPRIEELPETAPVGIKRSIELDPEIKDEVPVKRQKKNVDLIDLDEDSEDDILVEQNNKRKVELDEDFEDEIPLKKRRKNEPPTDSSAPKIKLKFKAPPPPPPSARPKPTPLPTSTSSTPRKRTTTKLKKNDSDSDDDYIPDTTSLPNIYTNTSLPYTTPRKPTSTPTRTPSITSSGRSISPPPSTHTALPNVIFAPGTRKIPPEIREVMAAVRKVKLGKDGLPMRTGLRQCVGFTGRDGVLKRSGVLWEWYGDTRVFSEREWRFFGSNEEGRRRRGGRL